MGTFADTSEAGFPPVTIQARQSAALFLRIPFGRAILTTPDFSGRLDQLAVAKDVSDPALVLFGSLALHEAGGERWKKWNERVLVPLVKTQVHEGEHSGSWTPAFGSGTIARIQTTALLAPAFETYYRYPAAWPVKGR